MHFLPPRCTLHFHRLWFHHTNNIWWRIQVVKIVIKSFSSCWGYLFPIRFRYLTTHALSLWVPQTECTSSYRTFHPVRFAGNTSVWLVLQGICLLHGVCDHTEENNTDTHCEWTANPQFLRSTAVSRSQWLARTTVAPQRSYLPGR
jgi:hypothetical protein